MNNTPAPTETESEKESEKVLNQEVANLQEDLDTLGDKLDNEELSIDEFQTEANSTLAKHTFKDFMEFFNNSYRKVLLTNENPDAYLSKQKVFIGDGKVSGKTKRRKAKTEEIKIKAALRQMSNVLDAYQLKKITNAYVGEKCVNLRNSEEAIESAKKWFNNVVDAKTSKSINADALNAVKSANVDLLDTLGTHLLLGAKALAKSEGTYDVTPMCVQLAKNANAVAASIMAARTMSEEELKKIDFTALEVFSNALKDFNSVVEAQISANGANGFCISASGTN